MSYMFGVYYVKTDAPIQELAASFGRAAPAGPGWLACGMSEDLLPDDAYQDQDAEDPEVTATGEISKVYGEAVYLFANSHADEVIYEHTRDGVVLRKLQWVSHGADCTWEVSAGDPEPWEAALFAEQRMKLLLERFPDRERQIRFVFDSRHIHLNTPFPKTDATITELIETYLKIIRPH